MTLTKNPTQKRKRKTSLPSIKVKRPNTKQSSACTQDDMNGEDMLSKEDCERSDEIHSGANLNISNSGPITGKESSSDIEDEDESSSDIEFIREVRLDNLPREIIVDHGIEANPDFGLLEFSMDAIREYNRNVARDRAYQRCLRLIEEEDRRDAERASIIDTYESFVDTLDKNNILSRMGKYTEKELKDVREKYSHIPIPPPITHRKKLFDRAGKYMDLVAEILNSPGKTSKYYTLAKSVVDESKVSSIWQDSIPWGDFHAGYFGYFRQSILGSFIYSRFTNRLLKMADKNHIVSYWTPQIFATVVLASEVMVHMAMEDIGLDYESSYELLRNSTDYGQMISNHVDIEGYWIGISANEMESD